MPDIKIDYLRCSLDKAATQLLWDFGSRSDLTGLVRRLGWPTATTLQHVCVYVCVPVCMYVCMYVCMHACIYVSMYVCMYVCIYVYLCGCLYGWLHACLSICLSLIPDSPLESLVFPSSFSMSFCFSIL